MCHDVRRSQHAHIYMHDDMDESWDEQAMAGGWTRWGVDRTVGLACPVLRRQARRRGIIVVVEKPSLSRKLMDCLCLLLLHGHRICLARRRDAWHAKKLEVSKTTIRLHRSVLC